jgi:diacylglycerol kinase
MSKNRIIKPIGLVKGPPRPIQDSIRCAWRGIVYAFRTQRNMGIHLAISIFTLAACLWFGVNMLEWLLVLMAITLVFATEIINTALEVVVDVLERDRRPTAMIIKDLAAGAVLICAIVAALIGGVVFFPRIFG